MDIKMCDSKTACEELLMKDDSIEFAIYIEKTIDYINLNAEDRNFFCVNSVRRDASKTAVFIHNTIGEFPNRTEANIAAMGLIERWNRIGQ